MVTKTFTALILLTIWSSSAYAQLDVGDKAPAISISEWVQGDAVDFNRDMGKKFYMVEFWATWCGPCKMTIPRLSEFQDKYRDELTIIGVTSPDDRGNSPRAIKRFVKSQGDGMRYSVAIDKGDTTSMAYLAAAGVPGIPHAFLVAKDGRIAWHGSPLDPILDTVLPQVLKGTYDIESAKKKALVRAEVDKRFEELSFQIQFERWSRVWDGLIGILQIDPANAEALNLLLQVYLNQKRDMASFTKFAQGYIEAHRQDAALMQQFAELLSVNPDLSLRTPELAVQAAKAALEASDGKDAVIVATYAFAMFQIGDINRAIELQKQALALSSDDSYIIGTLRYYKECKAMQDSQ